MKSPIPLENPSRFNGRLRHYHRAGCKKQRTWEEWIEGEPVKSQASLRWPKIVLIAVACVTLAAIIIGLIVGLS